MFSISFGTVLDRIFLIYAKNPMTLKNMLFMLIVDFSLAIMVFENFTPSMKRIYDGHITFVRRHTHFIRK